MSIGIVNEENDSSVFMSAMPYALGSLAGGVLGGYIAVTAITATVSSVATVASAVAGVAIGLFGSYAFFLTVMTAIRSKDSKEFKANIMPAIQTAGAWVVTEMVSSVARAVLDVLVQSLLNPRKCV